MSENKENLIGFTKKELKEKFIKLNLKSFVASQVYNWIYNKGIRDFDNMSNLSKDAKSVLSNKFSLSNVKVLKKQKSVDGTIKWLLGLYDKNTVEMVYIPENNKGALCISSQVGCPLKCAFCYTGTEGFTRDLSVSEILEQFMIARDEFSEWPSPVSISKSISSIVFMGMGEPLLNYDSVKKAVRILLDEEGLNVSKRKITISTSGLPDLIENIGKDLGVKLALSLHFSNDELRSKYMPINKKYPLDRVLKACKLYQNWVKFHPITMEYVMLLGINDSAFYANELINLVKKYDLKVIFNLIPFNKWDGVDFNTPAIKKIQSFAEQLKSAGFEAPIRKSRGKDILAACGQLKGRAKTELKSD